MPAPALVTVFTLVGIYYAPGANEAPLVQNYYFETQADCEAARKSLNDAGDDFYVNLPPVDPDADAKADDKPQGVPVVDIVTPKCFKSLVSSKALEKTD